MNNIVNLFEGFLVALEPINLLYSFIGVFLGNVIGVLPGIGPLAAISILLPITYNLDPTAALMMLAGLYYGAQYGGAITSILLNIPGITSHAVTCFDGYPMAKQGLAAQALLISMFASFIGASAGIILITLFTPFLTGMAFKFGAVEYSSILMLGLLLASTVSVSSPLKGIAMMLLGLVAGLIGTDINSGVVRFSFGFAELNDGIAVVAIAMGLFGISDVLRNANRVNNREIVDSNISIKSMRLNREERKKSIMPIVRGSAIGSLFGILPGTGSTIASFMSYAIEKKISLSPRRFGHGAIEGVAGPEAANSAAAQTAFIPTMSIGVPGDAVMALMLGALMIQNIQPGPQLINEYPLVFWGLIASFWVGNLLLLIINVPLIGCWTKMLSIPYRLIFPIVLSLICIGVYSTNGNVFDVLIALAVGVFSYSLSRLGFQPAPLLMGFVLGPIFEENLRRAMLLSRGDVVVFLTNPISATCIFVVMIVLIYNLLRKLIRRVDVK
ncbi:tripartite tricarboxylate transporter permease [Enterobacter kobei]|uniref:tripartite tricarboxylate transporter permease n=1 Tax=Enterobacter kobei TaxID=208224 RepID=UPI002A80F1E0|nr:tripartite tricarboxylate transporter permease [Enterobacter kobei]